MLQPGRAGLPPCFAALSGRPARASLGKRDESAIGFLRRKEWKHVQSYFFFSINAPLFLFFLCVCVLLRGYLLGVFVAPCTETQILM